MATNYFNVLDRTLGFTQDSTGGVSWALGTEPTYLPRELGNFSARTAYYKYYSGYNLAHAFAPSYACVSTTNSLTTGTDVANTTGTFNSWATASRIYIGMDNRFGSFVVTIGNTNSTASTTMSAQYWNGSAWTTLAVSDGTSSGAISFAQTGTVSFVIPTDWASGTLEAIADAVSGGAVPSSSTTMFWIRIYFNQILDASVTTTKIQPKHGTIETIFGNPILAPSEANDETLEWMDATTTSYTLQHTGAMQVYAGALAWATVGSAKVNTLGNVYGAWPTFSIGANVTVTNLYSYRAITSGGTVSGTISNYTGFQQTAFAFNVAANWYGVDIGTFSGTSTNGVIAGVNIQSINGTSSGAQNVYGVYVAGIATAGNAAAVKVALYAGPVTGTGAVNSGLMVQSPSGGTYNIGTWLNGGLLVDSGGITETFTSAGTLLATAGAHTYTTAQLLTGLIKRDPAGASRSDTMPAATAIIAAFPTLSVGSTGASAACRLINVADAAETITLVGGTGVSVWANGASGAYTSAGTATQTLAQHESALLLFTKTNTNTIDMHIIGA